MTMLWCSRADMEKIMEVAYVKHRQIMHVKYLCGGSPLGTECFYGIDWESRGQLRFLYQRVGGNQAALQNEFHDIIENQGILPSQFRHNVENFMPLDDVQRFGITAPSVYEGSWDHFTRARCRNDNLYTSPRIKFDDDGNAAICGCDLLDSIIPIDVCVKGGEWQAKWCVPPTWWQNDDAGDDHPTFESECRLLNDDSLSSCFHQDTEGKGARQWFDSHALKIGAVFKNISSAFTDATATETDLKVRFQLPTGMQLPRDVRLTKCPPDTLLTVWDKLFARTGLDGVDDSLCTERIAPVLFEHGRPPIGYVERVAPTLRALEIAIGVQDHEPMPKRMRIKIPIRCTLSATATTTKSEYKAWYIPPFQTDDGGAAITVGPVIVDQGVDDKDIDDEINRSLESSGDTSRGVFLLTSGNGKVERLTERHFEVYRCSCSAAGSRAMDDHANTGNVRDQIPSHKRINVGTPVQLHECSDWKIVVETQYKHDAFQFRVKGDDCGWRKEGSIHKAECSDAVKKLQDLVDHGKRRPYVRVVDARVPADGRHPSSHFNEIDVGSTVDVELQSSSARSWRYHRPWLSSGGAAVQGTVVRHDLNTGLYDVFFPAKKQVPKSMQNRVVEFHPRDITRVFRGSRNVDVDPRNAKEPPPLSCSVTNFLQTRRKVFLCGAYGKIIVKKGDDQGYHWIYDRIEHNISSMRAGCLFACNHATRGVQGTNISRLKKQYGIDVPKSEKSEHQSTKHICDIFETMLAGGAERILSASSTWSHVMDPAFGERKKVVMFYLMEFPRTHDGYYNSIQLPTQWEKREPTPGVTTDGVPHCMRYDLTSYGRMRSHKHKPPKPKTQVQAYRCTTCRNIPGMKCKVTGLRCVRELQAPNFDRTLGSDEKEAEREKGATDTYSVPSSSSIVSLPMCEENSKNDIHGNTYFGYKSQAFFPPSYILRKYDRSIKTIWGHTLQDPERNMWVLVRVRNEEVKTETQRKHALMTYDDYEKAKRLRRV